MDEQVISLTEVFAISSVDQFWALRGHAIQAYAALEQSFCMLFSQLAGVQPDIGGIIFFKITSSQARNSIIERLLKKRHSSRFNLFWNSYLNQLRAIDIKRNEIVHWNIATNVSGNDPNGRPIVLLTLTRPNFYDRDTSAPDISAQDLLAFMEKCDVFARAATMFSVTTSSRPMGEDYTIWFDIFQKPFVYPLPAEHPLARKSGKS